MGAFGLNASIMDASNLAWKIGLVSRNRATLSSLLPTYDLERRIFAQRIIKVSGSYLRFVCNSYLPLANLEETQGGSGKDYKYEEPPPPDGTTEGDLRFLGAFFSTQDKFLLGLDAPYNPSVLNPGDDAAVKRAVSVRNGVRAPNPRVCFSVGQTGYLYDKMTGASRFHILIFGSDLGPPVRDALAKFSATLNSSEGWYARFGGREMFNVVLVTKMLPHEAERLLREEQVERLGDVAVVLYDDRAPDEDAHYWYGVNHAEGAVVVVRPDLWVGMSTVPGDVEGVERYFGGFLVPRPLESEESGGYVNGVNGVNGHSDLHQKMGA